MSTVETIPAPETSPPAFTSIFWHRVDECLEWFGDKLNPIVVKEARQALKSKQFSLTFYLLLVCGGCWTAIGIAMRVPEIFHVPSGGFMVRGYYLILCVPMLLVVPFVAFRSLATEREDGTFELLSITTLNSWQIVLGKLASAMLQMMVYYSALAPCIALTYLLKGLDILTILLFLGFLWLASMVLSAFGLALGTVTKARHWQVLLSVLLIAGLVFVLFGWINGADEIFEEMLRSPPYDQPDFWMAVLATAMFSISFILLFLVLAAGQISFASDNRSTPIRWVFFGQHVLWFGWTVYFMLFLASFNTNDFFGVAAVSSTIAVVYWWCMGSFLIGERAELSPRVRRSLPQSLLGRTLLTWFNPGSGTGYAFTMINIATFMVMLGVVSLFMLVVHNPQNMRVSREIQSLLQLGLALLSYLSLYLGVGRFIVLMVRNRTPNTVWFSFLLQIVLVAFGTLIPLVLQYSFVRDNPHEYSWWQITNVFWTLAESLRYRSNTFSMLVADEVCYIVIVLGGVMTCLQFYLIAIEINQTRVLAPQRVREEDAALIAEHTVLKRKNPWDEPGDPFSKHETEHL